GSTTGVRMLRYPYWRNTSRAASSRNSQTAASSGRISFIPRTACRDAAIALAHRLQGDRPAFRIEMRGARLATEGRAHVIGDDPLEFLRDVLALERHRLLSVDIDRCDGNFPGAGERDPDVGEFRFAGPVHHAAHHRDFHRLDAGIARTPHRHLCAQITLDL